MNIAEHLEDRAIIRNYNQGETINVYSLTNYIAILKTGLLKVQFTSFNSRGLMEILDPGAIFSEDSFLFLGREIENIVALEDSTIALINESIMERELESNPDFTLKLLRTLSRRALLYSERLLDFGEYDAKKRTKVSLNRLLRVHGKAKKGHLFLDLPLTQEDMASLFGVSRVTVAQTLKDLRSEGKLDAGNGLRLRE